MKGIVLIALVAAGIYYYQTSETVDQQVTVKELKDKLSYETVSAQEAEIAFRNAAVSFCEVNGANTINGYGTTEQCLARLEAVSDGCISQVTGFHAKTYSNQLEFDADFSSYFHCTANQLLRT